MLPFKVFFLKGDTKTYYSQNISIDQLGEMFIIPKALLDIYPQDNKLAIFSLNTP